MKCNVTKKDTIIRILLGLFIMALGLYFQSWWGAIALLPLYTISIAWCPKFLFCAAPSKQWWHQCCRGCC